MEAVMPGSITQLLVGTAVAMAMALAGVSVIGSAVAQSRMQHIQASAHGSLIGHHQSPISDPDTRLADRQQLRKIILGN
jgi:hypothetical protein